MLGHLLSGYYLLQVQGADGQLSGALFLLPLPPYLSINHELWKLLEQVLIVVSLGGIGWLSRLDTARTSACFRLLGRLFLSCVNLADSNNGLGEQLLLRSSGSRRLDLKFIIVKVDISDGTELLRVTARFITVFEIRLEANRSIDYLSRVPAER